MAAFAALLGLAGVEKRNLIDILVTGLEMDPFILQAVVTGTGVDKDTWLVGAILLDLTRSWVEHVVCELTGLECYSSGKTRYWSWFGSANSIEQKE
jgi:hypothetical protein